MGLFNRFRDPSLQKSIESFQAARRGVEAYFEPKTINFPQSVLLVDGTGEWRRVPVKDERQAETACRKLGIPFYDARVVGYPDRMRGVKKDSTQTPSPEELEKWVRGDQGPTPSSE